MKKGIVKNIIYRIFNLRYKGSNKTIKEVLFELRTKTHCGKNCGVKPKFHILSGICTIFMDGYEFYTVDMETGKIDGVSVPTGSNI